MSPAKLLGLPQTEDSIIVRSASALPRLPQPMVQGRVGIGQADAEGSRSVLRSLIAFRKRGAKE
jgi:hypothetical protein